MPPKDRKSTLNHEQRTTNNYPTEMAKEFWSEHRVPMKEVWDGLPPETQASIAVRMVDNMLNAETFSMVPAILAGTFDGLYQVYMKAQDDAPNGVEP